MRKAFLFFNLLFFLISCASFYVFFNLYSALTGSDSSTGEIIVSVFVIHIPFVAQLGSAVVSLLASVPAFKLESAFSKVWLTVIVILTLIITAITAFLYLGFVM